MCNPPFYKNYYEAQGLHTRKPYERHDPSSINTATDSECIFDEGGEVGFVKKIIDDSIVIGKQIRYCFEALNLKLFF
jgi:23S rRNA A1618 N6-methylase RlmF